MYFARTLLVPVLLMGGLMEVASAQHKYIFPQFAFGGGWESTLMVQALADNTACTFSAQDRFFTIGNPSGDSISETSIELTFGMNGWTILKTATPQGMAASSGMAVLDCDEEVSANTLFSLEVGGSLVAEALVESSEEIVSGESAAQFLADHRDGARFAMAVANPSDQPLGVLIAVGDLDGQQIGEVPVNIPANAAQAFFVDALVTIPTGHTGQVLIGASNNPGPSVYVVGLRVTGLVITTIPATVLRLTAPGGASDTPRTFGPGTWLVNEEIAPGRYFTNPSRVATGSDCRASEAPRRIFSPMNSSASTPGRKLSTLQGLTTPLSLMLSVERGGRRRCPRHHPGSHLGDGSLVARFRQVITRSTRGVVATGNGLVDSAET